MRDIIKFQSLGVMKNEALAGLSVTLGKSQLRKVLWPYGTCNVMQASCKTLTAAYMQELFMAPILVATIHT